MDWQDKYLCPNVEKEKFSFKKIRKIVKDFFILLVHSISFHENPRKPLEVLPDFISQDDDFILSICKGFYDDANDRIDKIEEKAIKLLSYISALFAFLSFAFINTSFIFSQVIFLVAMILLVLSIFISFRCVNIKSRETIFLPSIYDFSHEQPRENFNKKDIAKHYLNASIFNQNIADNSADILKISRCMLAIALFTGILGFISGIGGYINTENNIYTVKIEENDNIIELGEIMSNTNKVLNDIKNQIDMNYDIKKINNQIDSLLKEVKLMETKYNETLKKFEELEQVNKEIN